MLQTNAKRVVEVSAEEEFYPSTFGSTVRIPLGNLPLPTTETF